MKHEHWLRFTWDVTAFGQPQSELPPHYEITRATAEDEKEIRKVISSSFTLDPAWNAAIQEVMHVIESWLDGAFAVERTVLLVLRHGTRIIGAAGVSLDPESDNHLSPGPCILLEYRNRGFGTQLLSHALATLHDAGVHQATAIAKESSPVAKFLYPKFNGVAAACDFTPLLAA
jgi:GNAT superfamily N-acetyltransferase